MALCNVCTILATVYSVTNLAFWLEATLVTEKILGAVSPAKYNMHHLQWTFKTCRPSGYLHELLHVVCCVGLEIWEEEARKHYKWGIRRAVAILESVSSNRARYSLYRLWHGSSQQNVSESSILCRHLLECFDAVGGVTERASGL